MNPIVIGYSTAVRDLQTVHNFIKPPTVPANYKKPDAIQKWEEENLPLAKAKWEAIAPYVKATGRLSRIVAVDVMQQLMFDSSKVDPEQYEREELAPGSLFFLWLKEQGYSFKAHPWASTRGNACCFYGFQPKQCLRLAGMAAIRDQLQVPLGFWYLDEQCLDPQQMLLETEVKDMIPLRKLLAEAPGGEIPCDDAYRPHVDPNEDVRLSMELSIRYQLFPLQADIPPLVELDAAAEVTHTNGSAPPSTPSPATKPKTKRRTAAK